MNTTIIDNNELIKFTNMLEKTNLIILIYILLVICLCNLICYSIIPKIQQLCCLYNPSTIKYDKNNNHDELFA